MDLEIAKQTQKILAKQGLKFKLNAKVLGGDISGPGVKIEVESAKGGKKETVGACRVECDNFSTDSSTSSMQTSYLPR